METPKERRKPGPVPGPKMRTTTVKLPPDLADWGKEQPGGLSTILRSCLEERYQRSTSGYQRTTDGADILREETP